MKRVLVSATALLGLAAAAVGVAIWQREPAVEWLAIRAAGWADVPISRLHVSEIGAQRAVLTDIRIGPEDDPDLSLDRLMLSYDAESLRHERVKAVDVAGLRIAARWRDGRLSLGALDGLLSGSGAGGGAGLRLPFDSLSLTAGEIALETPWGATRIPLHGDLGPPDGDSQGPRGRLTAGIDLDLKGGAGGLTAKGEIVAGLEAEGGDVNLAVDAVVGVSGDALAIEPSRLRGEMRIAFADGTVAVRADDCLALSLGQVTMAANHLNWPMTLCPTAAAKPILVIATVAVGKPFATLAARVPGSRLDGAVGGIRIAGPSPDIVLDGSWKNDGWTARIGLTGGDLALFDGRHENG